MSNYSVHESSIRNFDSQTVKIHPSAIIASDVVLGNHVVIHPYVVIESGVTIGDGVEIFPGAYLGKEPKGAGALARQPVFNRKIFIAANCSIGPHAIIYYGVTIGENTLIGDGASIREQVSIGQNCIISRGVTINYNTQIGDRTKIMDLTHITGNCRIGDNVFISTLVATTNDNNIAQSRHYDENHMQGPIIENGAVIGAGAILLPNIKIGVNAQIAAGAVVSKNVTEKTLVMGVPARFVRNLGD